MTTTDQTPLARAIDYLYAVQLADGTYACLDDETGSWWVHEPDELEYLGEMLARQVAGAYSLWCASVEGIEVDLPTTATPEEILTDLLPDMEAEQDEQAEQGRRELEQADRERCRLLREAYEAEQARLRERESVHVQIGYTYKERDALRCDLWDGVERVSPAMLSECQRSEDSGD
jgi:hypothetical protein